VKFQVNRDALSEAVSFAVRLLTQKQTMQILSGVLIEASDNALQLSVFDYEVSARAGIVAKVDEPGKVLVNGRLLSEIVSKLPNAPIDISLDGNKVLIKCGSAKFNMLTMPVAEYPTLPELPESSGTVSAEEFSTAVGQVVIAASKDDVTPQLNGILFEAEDKTITMMATDRYRISKRALSWSAGPDAAGTSSLVPARTLREVSKSFANQGDITIAISKREDREMIGFKAGNRTVTSQLLKGTFPPVRSLFPDETPDYAIVSTQDLIDSARRVSLVLEREDFIRFTFEGDSLTLEASGNETAQASESINAELSGDPISLELKPQLLIDGLTGVHSEFTKVAFVRSDNPNKSGPVLLSSHGSKDKTEEDNYRYLLQPRSPLGR
jgi:DNA polymerase-3 subunit beta